MRKTKNKKPANFKVYKDTKGKFILIALMFFCLNTYNIYAQTIPTNFFGINYWLPKKYIADTTKPGGVVNYLNVQTQINEAGSAFFRIAGNGYDKYGYSIGANATNNDYIAAIEAVKAVPANANAKFLIQIPFKSSTIDTNQMSPYKAGILVKNIKDFYPTVKFTYAIGNEWDLYRIGGKKYFASEMATKIKEYAVRMKLADSSIRILAPALSFFGAKDSANTAIMPILIGSGGANDITKIITGTGTYLDNAKFYINGVDFHTYAGGSGGDLSVLTAGNFSTYRNASIKYPNTGFATELSNSSNKLQYLLHKADSINARTGPNKLTYAITEMNINWKNPPLTGSTYDSIENTTKGLGPRSYFASTYWLDLFSAILKNGTNAAYNKVECVMPWSVWEHNGDGGGSPSTGYDLGMTKDSASSTQTPKPLPVYWAYQMMAKSFKETYLPHLYNSNDTLYKAFAYKNTTANEIGVIIMNQKIQSPRGNDNTTVQFKANFNSATPSGVPMLFSFNTANTAIGVSGTYSCSITNETIMLLVFDITTGALKKRQTYSLQDALRTIDSGTFTNITTQGDYDGYVDNVRSDIKIGTNPSTPITAGYDKTFRATNSIRLNGPFSSGTKTLSLKIDQSCP
jgi:hypothetical protein